MHYLRIDNTFHRTKGQLLSEQTGTDAGQGLLILDALSYLSFSWHQSELLLKVIANRSEKNSTIATTNLPFSKRTDLFENATMVAALVN